MHPLMISLFDYLLTAAEKKTADISFDSEPGRSLVPSSIMDDFDRFFVHESRFRVKAVPMNGQCLS